MHKRTGIFLALGLWGGAVIAHAQTEEITISTYYPAPYGVYSEMRSGRMAVGDNYLGPDYCWPPAACSNQIDSDADLVVEGRVGIGTVSPTQSLDINGQIRIRGGSPASNRVLTTQDASGLAIWQDPPISIPCTWSGQQLKRLGCDSGGSHEGCVGIRVTCSGGFVTGIETGVMEVTGGGVNCDDCGTWW